jgi:hypothetical protein
MLGAATAHAAPNEYDIADTSVFVVDWAIDDRVSGDYCGNVWFIHNGDWLNAADYCADGMSVGVIWELLDGSGRHGVCRNKSGVSTARGCNKNFPENTAVRYRAGKCDWTATNPCTHASHYIDLGRWRTRDTNGP